MIEHELLTFPPLQLRLYSEGVAEAQAARVGPETKITRALAR